jgi:hypothetical protein
MFAIGPAIVNVGAALQRPRPGMVIARWLRRGIKPAIRLVIAMDLAGISPGLWDCAILGDIHAASRRF